MRSGFYWNPSNYVQVCHPSRSNVPMCTKIFPPNHIVYFCKLCGILSWPIPIVHSNSTTHMSSPKHSQRTVAVELGKAFRMPLLWHGLLMYVWFTSRRKDIVGRWTHTHENGSITIEKANECWSFMCPSLEVNFPWKASKDMWFGCGSHLRRERDSWGDRARNRLLCRPTRPPQKYFIDIATVPLFCVISSRLFSWVAGRVMQEISHRENRITHLPTRSVCGYLGREI